jgi:hypothetical protein
MHHKNGKYILGIREGLTDVQIQGRLSGIANDTLTAVPAIAQIQPTQGSVWCQEPFLPSGVI